MYNNPYYKSQMNLDSINNQINELERMKTQLSQQMQQPANINQTFQLAPSNQGGMRYANSIDEVGKELVYNDTAFFSKDLSVLWIKNAKGDIKSYELNEIIAKDDRDILIENLQYQVKELRKEIENAKSINDDVTKSVESTQPSNVPIYRTSKKKQ